MDEVFCMYVILSNFYFKFRLPVSSQPYMHVCMEDRPALATFDACHLSVSYKHKCSTCTFIVSLLSFTTYQFLWVLGGNRVGILLHAVHTQGRSYKKHTFTPSVNVMFMYCML